MFYRYLREICWQSRKTSQTSNENPTSIIWKGGVGGSGVGPGEGKEEAAIVRRRMWTCTGEQRRTCDLSFTTGKCRRFSFRNNSKARERGDLFSAAWAVLLSAIHPEGYRGASQSTVFRSFYLSCFFYHRPPTSRMDALKRWAHSYLHGHGPGNLTILKRNAK